MKHISVATLLSAATIILMAAKSKLTLVLAWFRQTVERLTAKVTPAPSQENPNTVQTEVKEMSTQPLPITETAIVAVAQPQETTVQKIKNILEHAVQYTEVALSDIVQYVPEASAIATVIFPEFKFLNPLSATTVVAVTKSVLSTIVAIQQKYSNAPKGNETNAAKLADSLTLVDGSIHALNAAGVSTDTARMSKVIETAVAILKNSPAPKPVEPVIEAPAPVVEVAAA